MAGVEHQLMIGRSEFLPCSHDEMITYDLVRIHDGLQTMCDGEKGDILAQLLTQRLLDDLISLIICPQRA